MCLTGLLLAHWANRVERTGLMGFMEWSSPKHDGKKLMERSWNLEWSCFFFGVECSQTGLTPQLHKEVWKKILEYQEKLLKIIGAGMKIGSGAGIHGVELSQTLLVQYYTKKLWIKSTSSFAASWKIVVHEQTSPIWFARLHFRLGK